MSSPMSTLPYCVVPGRVPALTAPARVCWVLVALRPAPIPRVLPPVLLVPLASPACPPVLLVSLSRSPRVSSGALGVSWIPQ
jgi:hypothetical protein